MPRNAQGVYTLPPGNPVAPNTLIESVWANETLEDVGDALTGSLPRSGAAPMTGQLTLVTPPVADTDAASKKYVDDSITGVTSVNVNNALGYKNRIINCNLAVWQRGNSFTSTGYTADRFHLGLTSGSMTVSKADPSTVTLGWNYCEGNNILQASGSSAVALLLTGLEGVNTLANKTATLSYKIASPSAGSNSGAAPTLRQVFGTGGSTSVDLAATSDQTTVLGDGFSKRVMTFTVPSINGKVIGDKNRLEVRIPLTGTFTGLGLFDFQLEAGSEATTFDQRPVGETLALCQRYCQTISELYHAIAAAPSTSCSFTVMLPTRMRATPIINDYTVVSGTLTFSRLGPDRISYQSTLSAVGEFTITNVLFSAELE